jgi:predicted DsbA family dithiol-disulfide isomerase
MIDPAKSDLSVRRQCALLTLAFGRLPAQICDGNERSRADAPHRRIASQVAVLRLAAHDVRNQQGKPEGHAMRPLSILFFSDILCVWAHLAELRLGEARRNFGAQIQFQYRFCQVFGDVPGKMATGWREKGGYDGFADHVQHVAAQYPEAPVHPRLWRDSQPASSNPAHVFLKAVQICEQEQSCAAGAFERGIRKVRDAFFVEGRNVAQREVLVDIVASLDAPVDVVCRLIDDGRAHAALAADYKEAETLGVKGSPTMSLNEGRQKLSGNVGYRIVEANIQELLREPNLDLASWC